MLPHGGLMLDHAANYQRPVPPDAIDPLAADGVTGLSQKLARSLRAVASNRRAVTVVTVTGLAAAWTAANSPALGLSSGLGPAGVYFVQPSAWLAFSAVLLLIAKSGPFKIGMRWPLVAAAGGVGLFQVSGLVLGSLVSGFGQSPYGHSWQTLAMNSYHFGAVLLGTELARATLLAAWQPRKPAWAIAVSGLLFGLLSLPAAQFTAYESAVSGVAFTGLRVAPAIGEHTLASYMSLGAGPAAAIAYRGAVGAFEWYSPVLPDLAWQLSLVLGILLPYAGYRVFKSASLPVEPPASARRYANRRAAFRAVAARYSWPVITALSVGMLWFSLGVFPYRPALVAGDSMRPAFSRGDLAIIHRAAPGEITEGHVVQYLTPDGTMILHRAVAMDNSSGNPAIIAKGDANEIPDPSPVPLERVEGRVVFTVPKLGWPGILVKSVLGAIIDRF